MVTGKRVASLLEMSFAVSLITLLVPSACLDAQSKRAPQDSLTQTSTRGLSVKDSIEMARFERGGEPIFSPNRKYFAVVTSRGVIRSDEIESTLRVFKSEEVKTF